MKIQLFTVVPIVFAGTLETAEAPAVEADSAELASEPVLSDSTEAESEKPASDPVANVPAPETLQPSPKSMMRTPSLIDDYVSEFDSTSAGTEKPADPPTPTVAAPAVVAAVAPPVVAVAPPVAVAPQVVLVAPTAPKVVNAPAAPKVVVAPAPTPVLVSNPVPVSAPVTLKVVSVAPAPVPKTIEPEKKAAEVKNIKTEVGFVHIKGYLQS